MRPSEDLESGPTSGGRPEEPFRPRTYRPPLRTRFSYPLYICLCALVIWLCIQFPSRSSRIYRDWALIGFFAFLMLALIRASVGVWTTWVIIDADGIRWNGGSQAGGLRWEEISELGFRWVGPSTRSGAARLVVGLVQANPQRFHPLPICPRELYNCLKARLGPLPPEVVLAYFKA